MRLALFVFVGVGVAFQTALVAAQVLRPAAPEPAAVSPAPADGELPVSLDRISAPLTTQTPPTNAFGCSISQSTWSWSARLLRPRCLATPI